MNPYTIDVLHVAVNHVAIVREEIYKDGYIKGYKMKL
jgi:hypothetical protein